MTYLSEQETFMKEALLLAREAYDAGEVPVGAVIVKDGVIIGRGRNRRETDNTALAHAEIEAIHQACQAVGDWRLTGCDLYVTLEPCPMCAGAIVNARLDRVIYGASDDSIGSVGSVINLFDMPFGHRPRIVKGVLFGECSKILTDFFANIRIFKK